MLKFVVSDVLYEIPAEQIQNFPLKDALLNLLYAKSLDGSIGVQRVTTNKDANLVGAILIEHPCQHFGLVLRIYANPFMSMNDLLELDFLDDVGVEYDDFKQTVARHAWTDATIDAEMALSRNLLLYNGYRLLKPQAFKILKQELKFFGVYELFEPRLKRDLRVGKATIDPVEIIDRLHNDLDKLFNGPKPDVTEAGKYYMQNFIDDMKGIGAYMSGSLVLKHILHEEWPSTDVDLYVNETTLKGMLTINHSHKVYPDNHPAFKKFATLADARVINTVAREAEYAISLGLMVAKYFGATLQKVHTRTGTHLDNTKPTSKIATVNDILGEKIIDDEVYCCRSNAIAEGISAVIKLELHGVKVDVVIVNTTVPYFIQEYFDFGFNRVFYDGYNITVLDWKAVLNKRCQNRLQKSLGTREQEYLVNIKRIAKYTRRGFLIQPRS